MRLLLDTHALLWWLFDDPRLTKVAAQAIAAPEHEVLVSAASAWEISTKHRIGKLPEAGDVPTNLASYLRKARFHALPMDVRHGLDAGALPGPHRDPFDRMLAAQAIAEGLRLVTNDPVFAAWPVDVLW